MGPIYTMIIGRFQAVHCDNGLDISRIGITAYEPLFISTIKYSVKEAAVMSVFDEIQSALRERADLNARLSLIPYEGTPGIKEVSGQKYLYN